MNKASVFSIAAARNRTPKATTASRRVLVASGCDFFAHLTIGFLEELGYSPELVTSGVAFLEASETDSFALYQCDSYLPDMDVVQIAKLFRIANGTAAPRLQILSPVLPEMPFNLRDMREESIIPVLASPADPVILGALCSTLSGTAQGFALESDPRLVLTPTLVREPIPAVVEGPLFQIFVSLPPGKRVTVARQFLDLADGTLAKLLDAVADDNRDAYRKAAAFFNQSAGILGIAQIPLRRDGGLPTLASVRMAVDSAKSQVTDTLRRVV